MIRTPCQSTAYYLIQPGKFEARQIIIKKIPTYHTILSPLYTAICGSDLQYWRGEKAKEKLAKRLPLILLHEGVCIDRLTNQRVVPIAGDFRNLPKEYVGRENTWPELPYMGATMHGLARTFFLYPQELTLPVPDAIPNEAASLIEPLSIAIRSVKEMELNKKDKIAIIGTGGMAYLLVIALLYFQISKKNIYIFGVKDKKLQIFTNLCNIFNYHIFNLSSLQHSFDAVFEAVGRSHFNETLLAAFNLVRPAGKIGVIGVTDYLVTLPFNQLVNHRILIKGLTRSTPQEYKVALSLLKNKRFVHLIKKQLVNPKRFIIQSADDLKNAFNFAESGESYGRILQQWRTKL